jgi:sulfate adenylyltransferase subunit 2
MNISYLKELESESIHIIRETVAEAKNPCMLYSIGKDSSVMIRLAKKAFAPALIPFPVMHVDTSYKFPEMYDFRDEFVKKENINLIIYRNEEDIDKGVNPYDTGIDKCCSLLKTKALLDGIKKYNFDMAFGGARREEEKSRAKERVFSVRDKFGQWNPKLQRPELWNIYNSEINEGESIRIFPLSNWTEIDIWNYIKYENIPIVPLYFAVNRDVWCFDKSGVVFPINFFSSNFMEKIYDRYHITIEKNVSCRFRSLGCIMCTGAIRSEAKNIDDIITELKTCKKSERENRLIDLSSEASMEVKKREGYF